jgi:DNA-binding PadR family transcriptional regulator
MENSQYKEFIDRMRIKEPLDEEVKNFIKGKIKEGLKDPDKMVDSIFKNIKGHWIFGKRCFMPWVESPEINPFVNMILTRSGLLPLFVLHMLQKNEMFGNEIMSEIVKRTSYTWSTNPGTIYPLLKELEVEKFVEGKWHLEKEHPRRVYKITKKGRDEYKIIKAVLKEQLKEAINIFNKIFDDIYFVKFSEEKKEREENEKK